MKSYKVFNAQQIEGLPEEYYTSGATAKSQDENNNAAENLKEHQLLPRLEEFIKNTKANIRYGGIESYYKPSTDHI